MKIETHTYLDYLKKVRNDRQAEEIEIDQKMQQLRNEIEEKILEHRDQFKKHRQHAVKVVPVVVYVLNCILFFFLHSKLIIFKQTVKSRRNSTTN